jgi:hypothetical protein
MSVSGGFPGRLEVVGVKVWSEDQIEDAYQLWSTVGEQQAPKTVELFSAVHGETLSKSTVYYWIKTYGWKDRYRRELAVGMRTSGEEHVLLLGVAAVRAVKYLDDTVQGRVLPDTDRIRAAGMLEAAGRSLILKSAAHHATKRKQDRYAHTADLSEEQRRSQRDAANGGSTPKE